MDCPMETTTSSSGSARKHRSIQFTTFDLDSNLPRKCSTIHEIVQAQVKLRGDEIAVSCGDEKLTYRELEQRAAQLAHRLQKLGVQPESLVGIFMDRSIRTVVAILGVLKAGGAYLPIDLVYPDERVDYILKEGT